MKLKAKEGKDPIGSTFSWPVGRRVMIVALGTFCTSPVILRTKMQLTFVFKLVLQFLVDPVLS